MCILVLKAAMTLETVSHTFICVFELGPWHKRVCSGYSTQIKGSLFIRIPDGDIRTERAYTASACRVTALPDASPFMSLFTSLTEALTARKEAMPGSIIYCTGQSFRKIPYNPYTSTKLVTTSFNKFKSHPKYKQYHYPESTDE